jgi:hypothetical protein
MLTIQILELITTTTEQFATTQYLNESTAETTKISEEILTTIGPENATLSKISTEPPRKYPITQPSSIPWAPAVAIGGLASLISEMKHKKLNCSQKLKNIAEKLASNPKCQCQIAEMLSSRGKCERASPITFEVKLKKLCGKEPSRIDEKLAASLAVLKVS